ncbi:MAG: SUMF1/EgtB/PvdO family nonheme iron enzyme [Phycisphaerales bacterium]|nr:SUMF1/EgtB/PvdO family nonheme iron enzyme [Phycisphaerales bacterium]
MNSSASARLNHRNRSAERIALALLLAAATASAAEPPTGIATPPATPAQPAPQLVAFSQEVPVAAYKIEMLPIPGSAPGATGEEPIKPFYMSKTELGWEAFDVYIYRLDEEAGKGPKDADAVTRPSKPYLPPDRGFGHEGYAAISMSHKNATEFCKWLSLQTGRSYRLPTEDEWEHAARAGAPASSPTGNAVPQGATLADCAWFAANAADTPHPVGKKRPNAWGLCDMLGNAAEWVTDKEGKPVAKGGSFRDPAEKLTIAARVPMDRAWNASDPQIPKSKWWLSDGPHIGFRIVCDAAPPVPSTAPAAPVAPTPPAATTPAITQPQPEKHP